MKIQHANISIVLFSGIGDNEAKPNGENFTQVFEIARKQTPIHAIYSFNLRTIAIYLGKSILTSPFFGRRNRQDKEQIFHNVSVIIWVTMLYANQNPRSLSTRQNRSDVSNKLLGSSIFWLISVIWTPLQFFEFRNKAQEASRQNDMQSTNMILHVLRPQ